MIKKLEPKPTPDKYDDFNSFFQLNQWADQLHAHHIEETTSLAQKLEKERARVDELLRKNTQLVNEKREALYQARDQKVLNDVLLSQLAELKDPLYEYNRPGTREKIESAFKATPEELSEAAVMAARQDALICKWCVEPVAPGDNICVAHRKSHTQHSLQPSDAVKAKLDDPDAP